MKLFLWFLKENEQNENCKLKTKFLWGWFYIKKDNQNNLSINIIDNKWMPPNVKHFKHSWKKSRHIWQWFGELDTPRDQKLLRKKEVGM